jgi:hypothetical protein
VMKTLNDATNNIDVVLSRKDSHGVIANVTFTHSEGTKGE